MEITTAVAQGAKDYVNNTARAQHAANIEYDWLAARMDCLMTSIIQARCAFMFPKSKMKCKPCNTSDNLVTRQRVLFKSKRRGDSRRVIDNRLTCQ